MTKQNSFNFDIQVKPTNSDDPPAFVRSTSRRAYRELKDTGRLGKQEQIIYKAISSKPGSMTLQEISKVTGLAINAVSGRVNGMKEKKYLSEDKKRNCRVTGRTVIPVRIL